MIARSTATLALALVALAASAPRASPASAQQDCDGWNTSRFFGRATTETVTVCLEAGADVNARSELTSWPDQDGGNTPLHFAARSSWDLAMTMALLAAGADVDARNQRGATPLHVAAQYNHNPAIIVELVGAGADLDARDGEGNTPLHASRWFGHPPVVHLLLELGADPTLVNDAGEVADPMDCGYWNTEAFAAVAIAEATAACVEAGADVNARNENGMTPLLLATSFPGGRTPGSPASEDPAVVSVLLEVGADVNARDNGRNTALRNAAGGKLVAATRGGMFDLAANADIVAVLLAAGADVNPGSPLHGSMGSPLHGAAFAEDVESVRMLLDAGADIHARDWRDKTPLLAAADHGGFRDPEVLEVLVEAGADVNDRDDVGRSVLEHALASPADRVADVVRRLLDLGADANEPGVLGAAARRGDHPEVIEMLRIAGAEVNVPDGYPGRSVLHAAAARGGPGVIASLVAGGAVVDAPDDHGMTPLHVAVEEKNPANVAALLGAGADVHARTRDGDTPLHLAAIWPPERYSRREDPPEPDTLMVVALAAAGADLNARNDRGETPLHVATANRHQPVVDGLLALGADPVAVDDLGRAPRPAVCDWKTVHFVSAPWESVIGCLHAGADVHARNEDLETPLHLFATGGKPDGYPVALVVDAFVEAGADVNARNRGGGTPLHTAAGLQAQVAAEKVAALLDAGAAADARDSRGATPLHRAAGMTLDNDTLVSLLAAAGADLHATDDGGRTALHVALRTDNPAVAARLIELGADTDARDDSGHVSDPVDCARFNTATFFRLAPAEVVADCVERGADVNAGFDFTPGGASHSDGSTPFHFASAWARDPAVVPLLVRAGAEVNAVNSAGETPLHMAARRADDPAMIVALVEAGAELDAWSQGVHSPFGWTPLHVAVEWNRNPAVTAALIEAGADVRARQLAEFLARPEDGPTPLHDARSPEAVALLLEAGADIDARANYSRWRAPLGRHVTPLHLAARRGDAAVFMVLLEAGADPEAIDVNGKSPMDYAGEQEALRELEVVKRRGEVPRR